MDAKPGIKQPSRVEYTRLSERFKLLAHSERLRILDELRREPECVCHLSALLDKPQPYVSQQLRILREAGVIADEKDGTNVYYRVTDVEIESWLDLAFGRVQDYAPGSTRHRQLVSCPCPKCAAAVSISVDELLAHHS